MRYFLQYHNCDKLGWVPLDEQPFLQTQLAIYTRRPLVKKTIGDTVFVIASFGKPKRYYLWECFLVEGVEPEGTDFCAWGTGWQLVPPQRLQGEEFKAFHKACAWFIGFRAIGDLPYCAHLIDLTERYRHTEVNTQVEQFCSEILESLPDSGDAWFFRGFVRTRLRRFTEALPDLDEAIRRETEFVAEAEACRQLILGQSAPLA
jgi:hypothetical protein